VITVAGGVYQERCITPEWHQLYGSGGRAAAALTSFGRVALHAYVGSPEVRSLLALAAAVGFDVAPIETKETIGFFYFHPLSVPVINPPRVPFASPMVVEGDTILRFGMLEGDAVVHGRRVVYDPQSAHAPQPFGANGSRAESLAIVLNRHELALLTGDLNLKSAAVELLRREHADVVVVKTGSRGAIIAEPDGSISSVPAFQADFVFSIGSGDIFAAAFTAYWGCDGLSAPAAAGLASRVVARYCESRSASVPPAAEAEAWTMTPATFRPGKVYLAGPFFSMGERWLVEEARAALLSAGLGVFSPLHDVGTGPAEDVAPRDLAGLTDCDRMLALVDTADIGTVFEIGYARARGVPVIVFATTVATEDLKMIVGSGCVVIDDFCSAIYRTGWLS
jgi:nucleoside 2-deoxyribosyltransferase